MRSAEARFDNPLFFYVVCPPEDEEHVREVLRGILGVSLTPENYDAKLRYRTPDNVVIRETSAVRLDGICFTNSKRGIIERLNLAKDRGFSQGGSIMFEESSFTIRAVNP